MTAAQKRKEEEATRATAQCGRDIDNCQQQCRYYEHCYWVRAGKERK